MTIPIGDFPSGAYQGGYISGGSISNDPAYHRQRAQYLEELSQRFKEEQAKKYLIAVDDDGTYALLMKHPGGWGSGKLITILDKIPTLEEARDMKIARMVADKMAPEPEVVEPEHPLFGPNYQHGQIPNPNYIQPQPSPMPQITYWTNSNTTDGHNG